MNTLIQDPRTRLRTTPEPRASRRDWCALAVLMLPVLLVAVDNTVLSFAIPQISASFEPSAPELLWIIDVYPLVLAGLLVSMGSMADRWGRRRLLLIGAAGFTAVSALAAFAPSAGTLIAARAAMGFFGAMLMPSTLSLIRNIFRNPAQRRLAVAIWAAAFSGGAALGPIVGGFLLEHFWWGSVFLLAVPVLIPLLILGPMVITESRDPAPGRIDPVSIGLSFLAMVPLVLAIKSFSAEGWGAGVALEASVGLLALALFIRRQLRRSNPMLDVRLFSNPVFSGAVVANLLSVFSLVGFLFFVSQHLQLVAGLTPPQAGLVLLPGMIVSVLAGLAVAPLARRIRPVWFVTGGLILNAAGFAVIVAINPPPVLTLAVAFVILGLGVGAAETMSNDLILSSVPAHKAGAASAISETAYEFGSVLGTAVLGSILAAVYRSHLVLPEAVQRLPLDAAKARGTLGGALEVATGLGNSAAQALRTSAMAAFDSGAVVIAIVGLVLMLVAAGMSMLTLRSSRS
ncbi:MFS transporter [Psychromicrobium xiongbiense]|uniref:MFS transporter n=1 Tax=Psychromicrobium xiongbiense TaxID=3051184 RepID=UPI0025527CD4|nr:MFS transporter [Psychromicrobium sp. YIM S02556]